MAKCWPRLCVDDSQRSCQQCSAKPLESPSDHTLQDSESSQVSRSVAGFGRASHTFCRQRSKNQDTDWFHQLESPSSFSRMQLSHAGHPHCTQIHSEYAHDSTLSVAAVRLMESVRERLVASWNRCHECCFDITASKAKCDAHVYACNSCDSSRW